MCYHLKEKSSFPMQRNTFDSVNCKTIWHYASKCQIRNHSRSEHSDIEHQSVSRITHHPTKTSKKSINKRCLRIEDDGTYLYCIKFMTANLDVGNICLLLEQNLVQQSMHLLFTTVTGCVVDEILDVEDIARLCNYTLAI